MPIVLQNILIILLAAYMAWDNGTGNQITGNWPVIIGMLVGLIMGNLNVGLVIGGTLQLMSLGGSCDWWILNSRIWSCHNCRCFYSN